MTRFIYQLLWFIMEKNMLKVYLENQTIPRFVNREIFNQVLIVLGYDVEYYHATNPNQDGNYDLMELVCN